MNIPENLRGLVFESFSMICKWCGGTKRVHEGREQPHACRIEVP